MQGEWVLDMIIPMPRQVDGDRKDEAVSVASAAAALVLRRRAEAFSKDGKLNEAASAWQEVLQADHADADAAHELGLALAAVGKHNEAAASFERALHYAPGRVATKIELGRAYLALNRAKDARFNFGDLLAREPNNIEALAGMAAALRALGQFEDALSVAQRGALADPDNPAIALQLAHALVSLKRIEEATGPFERVLARYPDHREAGCALAKIMIDGKRPSEAVRILRKLVAAHPTEFGVWLDFGAALLAARAYGEAIDAYRRALLLKPHSAVAYANMALAFYGQGDIAAALTACEQCLAIEPDSSTVRFTKASLHLASAEFGPGWDEYEFRFSMGKNKGVREDIDASPWCGEDLKGKSILVLGEQANGDYFQFSRYASALSDMGADVSIFVPQRLKRVLSTLPGPVKVLDHLGPHVRPDFQIHMMSLPQRFHRLGLPIPAPPYLAAEPALRERWLSKIGTGGLRVGIVWQGAVRDGAPDARAFSLEHLRPLSTIPGVRLISLQFGAGVEQIDQLRPNMTVETLGPDMDSGEDGFIDTAAVMECLDLIVTSDTAMVHLAGALGKPLWIALVHVPEWRWQLGTTESCWYPSARLFRQPKRDDWDSVFREMATALKNLKESRDALALVKSACTRVPKTPS
jgi:tetratricopeptide (TPR) repeat protein